MIRKLHSLINSFIAAVYFPQIAKTARDIFWPWLLCDITSHITVMWQVFGMCYCESTWLGERSLIGLGQSVVWLVTEVIVLVGLDVQYVIRGLQRRHHKQTVCTVGRQAVCTIDIGKRLLPKMTLLCCNDLRHYMISCSPLLLLCGGHRCAGLFCWKTEWPWAEFIADFSKSVKTRPVSVSMCTMAALTSNKTVRCERGVCTEMFSSLKADLHSDWYQAVADLGNVFPDKPHQ